MTSFPINYLYRRFKLIDRFVSIFDLCIETILPAWPFSNYFENLIKLVKELLIISKKRYKLIDNILNKIPTNTCYPPAIHINRQLNNKNIINNDYTQTIFMQIYKHLKQETAQNTYNFRWPKEVDQWWECKFIGEGIIDQGGGFRDTLSDISEELCPTTTDSALILPYFIRSPNQAQSHLTSFKDTFILNPSCYDFDKYTFIGKLMGACLRSNENLILNLSPFVWKRLVDEKIDWTLDYASIDSNEVKLLDTLSKIDKDEYELKYAKERTWSCILSDGSCVELRDNGLNEYVLYEDRLEYVEKVKEIRLNESNKQLEALRQGIESVVTKHILTLLTWSELELKVCGSSEITIDDLKMSSKLSFYSFKISFL